ncbi:TetR/AcrR family transcriptional regulator [Erwinia sp. 9145]|uniref:TetR/AcrR family transcriptional regulator n=1 Tax=Erwinia sp. 9145 TaxID=1500895 RepID=UPI0005587F7E|nr:TetR/AcrR family transcriptional regulator [Erwinia sp. 9145]
MTDSEICAAKSRGRPKTFNREAAIDKALELFWRHGYEATSLSDLVEATGAKAPTLYAEFTNKQGMFRAVLERYNEKFGEQRKAALACPERSVAEGIEHYFRATAVCFTDGKKPSGCFFICTSTALSADATEVAEMLHEQSLSQENHLKAFLLARQKTGELDAETDINALSAWLGCILQGMSVRARAGTTRAELDSIIDTLMLQWPVLSRLGCHTARHASDKES